MKEFKVGDKVINMCNCGMCEYLATGVICQVDHNYVNVDWDASLNVGVWSSRLLELYIPPGQLELDL